MLLSYSDILLGGNLGNMSINPRLEEVLLSISAEMSAEEIEKRSRVQHRGRFSDVETEEPEKTSSQEQPIEKSLRLNSSLRKFNLKPMRMDK